MVYERKTLTKEQAKSLFKVGGTPTIIPRKPVNCPKKNEDIKCKECPYYMDDCDGNEEDNENI